MFINQILGISENKNCRINYSKASPFSLLLSFSNSDVKSDQDEILLNRDSVFTYHSIIYLYESLYATRNSLLCRHYNRNMNSPQLH